MIEQKGVLATKVQSASAGLAFDAVPPGPIIEGEYTNGQVYQGQVKYYFFPIEYETMGDPLILLNKTQMFSTGANGDTKLLINMQPNILDPVRGFDYKAWTYPTEQQSGAESATGRNTWPELVDVCKK